MFLLRYAVVAGGVLAGATGLLAFGLHLWRGSPGLVRLELSTGSLLAWDAVLSLLFFAQHSGMIRSRFRRAVAWLIPEAYYGAVYAAVSGVALAGFVALWQPSAVSVYSVDGAGHWLLRGLFLAAGFGMVWGYLALRGFDLFGIRPLLRPPPAPAPSSAPRLRIRGPYRWVRHPMYSLALVMIWTCPDDSLDRCLFNVVWTVWIVLGARLEERDLRREFGDAYRDYQQAVPMLIPRHARPPG